MTAMLISAFVLIFYRFNFHFVFVSLQARIIPKKMFAKSSKPLELKNSKKCKYKVISGFTQFSFCQPFPQYGHCPITHHSNCYLSWSVKH